MKTIEIKCDSCNKEFTRRLTEHKRSLRKGRKEFCSRTCAGNFVVSNFGDKANRDTSHLRGYSRKDEFTGLRKFIRISKRRADEKNQSCDLDLPFLKELWEKQNGICPLTGWSLVLKQFNSCIPNQASIDRIDNSKGYIKENVRFIALIANYCRNNFSDEQLIDFCSAVMINSTK